MNIFKISGILGNEADENNISAYSQKTAFTLAEVLITIGIVGIVAAMTLPSLIQNYKYKVLETQLKKAYSDLNQASKNFQINNGMSVTAYAYDHSAKETLQLYQKEFIDVLKTNNLMTGAKDDDGNKIGASPYEWKDIKGTESHESVCNNSGFFWDPIGRVISFNDSPTSGYNGPHVCIDINGQKEPNRYGMDFFVFVFTTDGYVIPAGQEHKDDNPIEGYDYGRTIPKTYCQYVSAEYYQTACSYHALLNRHPEDEDKDYWHDFVRGR